VAEEIVYGHDNVTSGASSDIQQATRLAKAMVTKYGLSDKVGVLFLEDKDKVGGKTQTDVDEEVNKLLSDSYGRAKSLLQKHRRELDVIAKGLQEYESLSGGEIVDMINGKMPSTGLRSQRPSRATQAMPPSKEASAKAKAKARGAAVSASQVKQEASTERSSGSQSPAVTPSAPPQARKESPKAGFRGPPKP
jgi:glucan-binding YG repeat protein